jgi:hypothetical protein
MQAAFNRQEAQAELSALLADRRYKPVWYEQDESWLMLLLLDLLFVVPTFLLFGFHPPLGIVVVTLCVFVFSVGFDTYTTYRSFQLRPKFKKRKLFFSLREANSFFPDQPHSFQQLIGIPTLVDVGVVVAAFFLPGFAWMITAGHLRAGMNNRYQQKRLEYQLLAYDKITQARLGK